jgi:hypothetical protein
MRIMLAFYAMLILLCFWLFFVDDHDYLGFRRPPNMQRVQEIQQETERIIQDARKRGYLPQESRGKQ